VIDDNSSVRTTYRMYLGHLGFEVAEAASGELGIQMFKDTTGICLVITDFDLGAMDGLSVARLIVKLSNGTTPVILSSAKVGDDSRLEPLAYLSGVCACLPKPTPLKLFKEVVAKALRSSNQPVPTQLVAV